MRQNPITQAEGWRMWYEAISNLDHIEENKRQYEAMMMRALNKNISEVMQDYVNQYTPINPKPRFVLTNCLATRMRSITHSHSIKTVHSNGTITQNLYSETSAYEFSPNILPEQIQEDFIQVGGHVQETNTKPPESSQEDS